MVSSTFQIYTACNPPSPPPALPYSRSPHPHLDYFQALPALLCLPPIVCSHGNHLSTKDHSSLFLLHLCSFLSFQLEPPFKMLKIVVRMDNSVFVLTLMRMTLILFNVILAVSFHSIIFQHDLKVSCYSQFTQFSSTQLILSCGFSIY